MIKWIKAYFRRKRYEDYMQSKEWELLRQRVLLRDDYKCFLCDETENVEVHHPFYPPDIFDTKMRGCVSLCKKHHKQIEKKLSKIENQKAYRRVKR